MGCEIYRPRRGTARHGATRRDTPRRGEARSDGTLKIRSLFHPFIYLFFSFLLFSCLFPPLFFSVACFGLSPVAALDRAYLLLRGCSGDRRPSVNIVWLLLRRSFERREALSIRREMDILWIFLLAIDICLPGVNVVGPRGTEKLATLYWQVRDSNVSRVSRISCLLSHVSSVRQYRGTFRNIEIFSIVEYIFYTREYFVSSSSNFPIFLFLSSMLSNSQLLCVQRSYSLCSFSNIEIPFLWKLGIPRV